MHKFSSLGRLSALVVVLGCSSTADTGSQVGSAPAGSSAATVPAPATPGAPTDGAMGQQSGSTAPPAVGAPSMAQPMAGGATPPATPTMGPFAGNGEGSAGAPTTAPTSLDEPEAPDAPDPSSTDPALPTAGSQTAEPTPQTCDASAGGQPGRTVERVMVGDASREYILYVPSSYDGSQPVPLVVDWHPLLTNAGFAESDSGYKQLADREGFIVAFPDSMQSAAWNIGPCCTASRDVDDVGFARALVAQVQAKFCIDSKRVYSTGFSMGGGMSHYLACEAADLFAAVAPAAFDLLEENECEPARPISVLFFRSRSDLIVPYDGGPSTPPNGVRVNITFEGAEGTFARWAEINGCTGSPVSGDGGCQTYGSCEAGVEVTLCTVSGGHTFGDENLAWETLSRFTLP